MRRIAGVVTLAALFAFLTSPVSAVTIINDTFTDPANLIFGTYLSGAEGFGYTPDPTNYGYVMSGPDPSFGNHRDYRWIQDTGGTLANAPTGLHYDLGGQANKLVVFPIIDHGPLPQEAFEYDVFMSNDLTSWTEATLETLYSEGWDPNPAIADGWTTVWTLPSGQTFRYASVAWGNPGNPDPSYYFADGDNEIDAVAGLTEEGGGVDPVPEPSAAALMLMGLIPVALLLYRRRAL